MYTRLDEKDLGYGLKRLMCSNENVKNALTLSQYRHWVKAGRTFSTYIENANYEPGDLTDVLNKKIAEDGWVNSHKQLNDWKTLEQVIQGVDNQELKIELAW
mmetsp:Transcript_36716/g.32932  ORF Transcript_36716/g.32932 Transcript_36716/m.32932 type:complete len:102 (-) Transcript_36716:2965-3270(-)